MGVFFDVKINKTTVSVSFFHDMDWFNTTFTFAYFSLKAIFVNLILLFPYGAILPQISKKKISLFRITIIGFLISLFIEINQYILPINRYSELLDIINNTISIILGYYYYKLLSLMLYLFKQGDRDDKLSKQEDNNTQK